MGVFLYYLPGVTAGEFTRDTIRDFGLEDVFRDTLRSQATFQRMVIANNVLSGGPDGMSGVIVVQLPIDGTVPTRINFKPDFQEWKKAGRHWLGVDKDEPPTPQGLRREILIPGVEHELGDGQAWECPIVRQVDGTPNVPQSWGIDAFGKFAETVVPEFDWAWRMAGAVWDIFRGVKEIDRPEAFAYCARLLGLNYRIGQAECSLLRLINTENYPQIFKVAVNGLLIEEFLAEQFDEDGKKKEANHPPPENSSPGLPEETQAIGRPAEISSC